MIAIILGILIITWASTKVVGYKEVYTTAPVREFASVDDALEYAELHKSGWRGNIEDYYEMKQDCDTIQ